MNVTVENVKIEQISRNNSQVDALATMASIHDTKHYRTVTIAALLGASPFKAEIVINQVVDLSRLWFDPFTKYLSDRTLFP